MNSVLDAVRAALQMCCWEMESTREGKNIKSRDYAFCVLCCIGPLAFAANPAQASTTPCTPGICKIEVTVDESQTPCTVSLDKPDVSTTESVNLQWNIVDSEREFTNGGIVFDDSEQFEPMEHKPQTIKLHDKATRTGDFYYMVHVEGCASLDPYVRNK